MQAKYFIIIIIFVSITEEMNFVMFLFCLYLKIYKYLKEKNADKKHLKLKCILKYKLCMKNIFILNL